MAKKVTVTLIDDLDQEAPADETVEFALDGVQYEIDLSSENAARLRETLDEWVSHARKVSGRRKARGAAGTPSKGRASASREESAAIREWARQKGLKVSARGRISADIVDAYNKEN
ncbi:Lsr2 family protein [Rhodococcus triatomae]|uniref:Lsr2 protein n=1 Tax=Rhodococcus triatomae TaxID=300028 RepID=A0A1G8RXH1_9NOCA|nr:Lsr2 family protein [Rhodococcus triatomae]QNG17372.1 Lsr2 family protein [Rhodococcus triatomae]QNG22961.1 Lsr2 family protein [Rhodococcus triatomae]SDJ21612.1 Lsr2 protein [Rhodococcus triatomae]